MIPSSARAGEDDLHLAPPGFGQAAEQGLLSSDLLKQVPALVRLERLIAIAHASRSEFCPSKARDYFCYLYLNGWSLSLFDAQMRVDSFWHNSLTIFFYRMAFARPEVLPEKCAQSIVELLSHTEQEGQATEPPSLVAGTLSSTFWVVKASFPSALMWVALLAGPQAEANSRPWFCSLLTIAQTLTSPPLTNFDEALREHVKPCWLWCDRLTPSARSLWHDASQGRAIGGFSAG